MASGPDPDEPDRIRTEYDEEVFLNDGQYVLYEYTIMEDVSYDSDEYETYEDSHEVGQRQESATFGATDVTRDTPGGRREAVTDESLQAEIVRAFLQSYETNSYALYAAHDIALTTSEFTVHPEYDGNHYIVTFEQI